MITATMRSGARIRRGVRDLRMFVIVEVNLRNEI